MELKSRGDLEAKFQRDMRRLSRRQMDELIRLAGKPPDFRKVPQSFWKQIEAEDAAIIMLLLHNVFSLNAMEHGLDRSTADAFAGGFSQRRGTQVARQYAQNSMAKAFVAQRGFVLPNGQSELTREAAEIAADRIFGPARGDSFISTEFTTASVSGGETAMKVRGVASAQDLWITHPSRTVSGVCPRCKPLHRFVRTIWERIFPLGPPAHPNCACEIEYVNA